MFSKSTLQSYLIGSIVFASLLLNVSCGRFLQDHEKDHSPFQLDFKGVQCMEHLPEVLSSYFQQKLEKNELHGTILCMEQALGQFRNSVVGEQEGLYRSDEVQRFFQRYIFKRSISPELTREIMKLKAALLGGSVETVTRVELEKLQDLFSVIEIEMWRLYPHLGVFLMKTSGEDYDLGFKKRLDYAITDLRISVKNLLAQMNLADADYSLPEVDLLLGEVEKFAGITSAQHPFTLWRKNIPTLEKLKTLLVGEAVEIRSQREINEIWSMLIEVYRLGLQYHGGLYSLDWAQAQNFPELDSWIEDIFSVLNRALALRNKGHIPFARIDEMVDEFKNRGVWSGALQTETVKFTYRQFISRFLEESPIDLVALEGRHLVQLQREYKSFKLIQKVLARVFEDSGSLPVAEVEKLLLRFSIEREIKAASPFSVRDQHALREGWKEFLFLLKESSIHHWDRKGRFSVVQGSEELWSYPELTRMNFLRVLASVFMRSYSGRKGPAMMTSLSVDQMKQVFVDFNDFGNELRIFDLRNSESSGRSAREADMFTPGANGDNQVQFGELVDLFAALWSGGLVGTKDLKTAVEEGGCGLPALDYFKNNYFDTQCASRALHIKFGDLFPHLPEFSNYVMNLDDQQWNTFFGNLYEVSRVCPRDPVGLETGDQRTMMVIVHYVETLFSIYDKDRDGRLDDGEVELSFQRFKNFMRDVTRKKITEAYPTLSALADQWGWNTISLNVYKFVVFEGRIPGSMDIGVSDFVKDHNWKSKADRNQIIRVFAALKSELSNAPVNCDAVSL